MVGFVSDFFTQLTQFEAKKQFCDTLADVNLLGCVFLLCTNIPKLGCSLFWRMDSNISVKELITSFAIETFDSAPISDIENITKLKPELIERWLLTLPARK